VEKLNEKILALGKVCMIFFAILMVFFYSTPQANCSASPLQTIFADPFSINGTAVGVGNTVTVNINISDGLNVWSWGVALKFNPNVLNCTGVYEGEFLKRSGTTLWMSGTINNTLGQVSVSGASCTSPNPPVSGSGQLMYATFIVKAEGISDIHLLNVQTTTLIDSNVVATPCQVLDKYTLIADSGIYVVSAIHNATGNTNPWSGIPNLILDTAAISLKFNMTAKNTVAFCNVTIPKTLIWLENPSDTWTVKVAGSTVAFTKTEDDTNTYIYFTTTYPSTTTTKLVEIIGTAVIPEFQPLTIILILAMFLIAIITTGKVSRRQIAVVDANIKKTKV
jgi:hypothetical protein